MKISFTEILVVLAVALIVLGPDKLPYYAKKLGEALKEFKKVSSEATKDIRESVLEPLEEAQKPLREAMEPIAELKDEVEGNVKDIKKSFTDLGKPGKKAPSPPGPAQGDVEAEVSRTETPQAGAASGGEVSPAEDPTETPPPEPSAQAGQTQPEAAETRA